MRIILTSLSTALLVTFVLIVRSVALYSLPKKIVVILWEVALLRSLFFGTLPRLNKIPDEPPLIGAVPNIIEGAYSLNRPFLKAVWFIGALLTVSMIVYIHIKARLEYRFALPVKQTDIEQWQAGLPCRRRIRVKQSDRIVSAMTYGLISPVILLPSSMDFTDEKKLAYSLTHEYVHIQRFDLLVKWLLVISLSIHWFNPFAWLLFLFANRDMELACDEKVIHLLGYQEKSTYARFLLELATENKEGFFAPANYMAKSPLEERIVSLMKMKRPTIIGMVIAVLVIILLSFMGAKTASYVQSFSDLNNQQAIIVHGQSDELVDQPSYTTEASSTPPAEGDYDVSFIG